MKTTATICRWVVIVWTGIFVANAVWHGAQVGAAINAGQMTAEAGGLEWIGTRFVDLLLWAILAAPVGLVYLVTRDWR